MTDIDELLDTIELLKNKRDATNELYNDQISSLTRELEKQLMKVGKDCYETKQAVAFYRKDTKVEVEDWNVLLEYVKTNDAFDILQRRIAPAALARRIELDGAIRGVALKDVKTLIVKGKKQNAKESD